MQQEQNKNNTKNTKPQANTFWKSVKKTQKKFDMSKHIIHKVHITNREKLLHILWVIFKHQEFLNRLKDWVLKYFLMLF
jgi:hypothetical protein